MCISSARRIILIHGSSNPYKHTVGDNTHASTRYRYISGTSLPSMIMMALRIMKQRSYDSTYTHEHYGHSVTRNIHIISVSTIIMNRLIQSIIRHIHTTRCCCPISSTYPSIRTRCGVPTNTNELYCRRYTHATVNPSYMVTFLTP